MKWFFVFLSVLSVIDVGAGQVLQEGQCGNVPLAGLFRISDFTGAWYEIANAHPFGGDCSSIEVNSVDERLTILKKTTRENFYQEHEGNVTIGDHPAQLSLNITSLSDRPIDFWVIHTDYTIYALTYGCENVGTTHKNVNIWILGRETTFPNLWIELNLNTILSNLLNITIADLQPVSHSDEACYQLPVLEPGEAVILPGQCNPNITGVANFNAEGFLGVWHQIESYYSPNAVGSCSRAQYSAGEDRVLVSNSEIVNQALSTVDGYATVTSIDGSGELTVVLEVSPGIFAEEKLLVLSTDYSQYAVTYTCQNVTDDTRQIFSWVISRTRQLPATAQTEVDRVINSLVELNHLYYQATDQSDEGCFYVPERTDVNEPLVFGGQCNQSIPVVTGFSAEDYMGLWHEIEKYPTLFQFGECSNAHYSLVEDGVDVLNTQVWNEELLSVSGSAVPVEDGKLLVTFPIEGTNITTTSDYWILRTDYETYALVYSCSNINDYQQQVSFWKLSRTKQLSAQAESQINEVFSQVLVLDQQYFLPTDQSEEACFFYPKPETGVPVVFPGSCEANVPVIPNFNLTAFQGVWYEVEAYPTDPQEGQCINHDFSSGTGTAALDLVSSKVDDQLLTSNNGQLTFYANENGGRFTLSFVRNGTAISIPFYVIATDYTDYALVYSCLDQPNTDFREIWAWKLSRTNQLSNNGNTQINNVLASEPTVTLSNDYFDPIDQSDDACFHFPDLAPGEPVVLPGQCDTDIPYIRDFNLTAYLGRWRLIASYPYDDGSGQCKQANYTIGPDGNILIQTNEVVNQALVELDATATLTNNVNDGIINVVFPNTPEPTYPIYILATDYESYSLVYGCINTGNNQRRVLSFKLSRDTYLSDDAIAAIDTVTRDVLVLNDRYYYNNDQSDDACFYYPDLGSGPTVFRGQCDESIPVVTEFDAVGYMGLWHAVESYPMPYQDGSCHNADYTLNEELGRVEVFNTQVINQSLDTINGYGELVPSDDGSAKLLVTFPLLGPFVPPSPYWVLSTDYESYALVYSCQNTDNEHRAVTSWKLSRTKSMPPAAANIIQGIVDSIPVLDDRYYIARDQSADGCFYFPIHQPGVPVVFPGQCDSNLNVVQNFDLIRFAGVWHEIEAYPKILYTGGCVSHDFNVSASNNGLDLLSYNVSSQSLGISNAELEFAFNDNSARFNATFNLIFNESVLRVPFWIIDTDYENYALAYSCENNGTDFRRVWSWKLSKTKEGLRPVDETAINNAIADIDVLNNEYFEDVDQSDDACFFYPEPMPGTPVVFPGLCGDISAMPNFNATAYLGLWRLIESYPSPSQVGTCGDTNYSIEDGLIVVYNTEVVSETLSTIYGTAELASDGSGKLYVQFPNTPVIEYFVLDTDYDSYALVYSCINSIDSHERTVYSWKLGRENTLPPSAEAAISNTVDTIDVLDQRYFEAIDNSASGCFYFPKPDEDSPVIFRGQCDETVPVQANFNVNDYAGTWYNIYSYPSVYQDGTCSQSEYDIDPVTGIISVLNTQVLREVLEELNGTATVVDNAKLEVTLNIDGEEITANYWILATDYTSYSFVYSCSNINNEYKLVNSWKLSRTQSLPDEAVPIIDNVINNVQVLQEMYFVEERRGEVDCFFYPDNNGGDVILNGNCVPDSEVPAVDSLDANLFSGTWHEVSRFPQDLQDGECATSSFSSGAQGDATLTQTIVSDEQLMTNVIPATLDVGGRGVIYTPVVEGVPFDALYILATDYVDYALIYGCREVNETSKQIYSWKLARSRAGFSAASSAIIDDIVSSNIDLFERYYDDTQQTNDACFYYPEFDTLPEAIELPGPCDTRITGVANFDAAAYTGLWVEIERYPQTNQFGTCDRAYYSASDGIVAVRNSLVFGNSLQEQVGTAVPASDNSGRLDVTFVVNGVEVSANYYIIATDYENYALVYSCRNVNVDGQEKSLVSSWKLSRTTTLSPQDQTAINTAIDQTRGLNQEYYKTTSQSTEDCFYIPEVDANSAPLFRGRCGTISGVADFDANKYAGWWHELERYPIDSNIGQCISSQYTSSGAGFQVVDTSVENGEADIITGTVSVSDDGRLIRVLSNGVTQEIVVLATDYENYALLYSCEDVTVYGEPYRKVWSAKHSKSRDRTSVQVDSIDQIISDSEVLYTRFYQEVDQSNSACFHYPEVVDQRVILPGLCDVNIPVMQDFDVAAYDGTWYQVERYPHPEENQDGRCIGARYLFNGEADEVNVLNWQVTDGELETVEGTAVLVSEDGSARLELTLPVAGTNDTVTSSLYVLDTDYTSYSLVYTCSNLNEFQRTVGAWKLSRDRTLSSAGTAAINAFASQREELDARYFLSVDHDDDCPEPDAGVAVTSSVVLLLACVVVQLL